MTNLFDDGRDDMYALAKKYVSLVSDYQYEFLTQNRTEALEALELKITEVFNQIRNF